MDTLKAIYGRRSIRKFKNESIPAETVEKVLEAATMSPSAKNQQPWRFFVLEGSRKNELIEMINKEIDKKVIKSKSAARSIECMRQAPVNIYIYYKGGRFKNFFNFIVNYEDFVNIQSIGALIQTMLLAAEDSGLGSLWICDVIFFEKNIGRFLHTNDELVAAVALGYADESPEARPRKNWREISEWNKSAHE